MIWYKEWVHLLSSLKQFSMLRVKKPAAAYLVLPDCCFQGSHVRGDLRVGVEVFLGLSKPSLQRGQISSELGPLLLVLAQTVVLLNGQLEDTLPSLRHVYTERTRAKLIYSGKHSVIWWSYGMMIPYPIPSWLMSMKPFVTWHHLITWQQWLKQMDNFAAFTH